MSRSLSSAVLRLRASAHNVVRAFVISLITLLLAQTGTAADPQADSARTPVLTRQQFDELLAQPQQVLIVDVRRPDEITSIGGFPVYLSVQLADLEQRLAWIPKDRSIVVVSNHAKRAGRAGDLLTVKGFKVAGRIGVQTYEEAGGKIRRIAPRAPAKTTEQS